jgi:carboxymethylenebutenolidase
MIERTVEIPSSDGKIPAFVTHPQDGVPHPAIVVYMDVWGVREELYDIARRIATTGYYVMVPNLYYRVGGGSTEFRDANGKMISMEILDDARKAQVRAPMQQLSDQMVVNDTGALLKFLDAGEPVTRGAMGSIGYCMGGRHVVRVAGAFPERFKASASLHGTRLLTDSADSPHWSAVQAQGELYCGFAEHDPFAPLPHIQVIADAMRKSAATFSHHLHHGAHHGYALPDRDIHDKQAANRDWEHMFAMWRRQLQTAR